MQLKQQGFTLIETLVALTISAVLMLGAMRLFTALQRTVWHEYQAVSAHESLWQLAQRIGKQLKRAGYCREACTTPGLQPEQGGSRVMIQWQSTAFIPGRQPEYERTGYRLYRGSLQILRGDRAFAVERWENLTDPSETELTHFSVTRQPVNNGPPRLTVELIARQNQSQRWIRLRHTVRGENL